MNKNGPIVVIEDDYNDQEILGDIFTKLHYKNEIIYFSAGKGALEYLTATQNLPFLILSDINMPKLNGFELRDRIHTNEELKLKCIPYLFLTTAASEKAVVNSYYKAGQGFFVKPTSYEGLSR